MDQITDFTIDLSVTTAELFIKLAAMYAATDDAAVDVLIDCGAVHQRSGKADEIRESILTATVNLGIDCRRGACADRHDEQLLFTGGPVKLVSLMRCHACD